jgi:hypothetical protein
MGSENILVWNVCGLNANGHCNVVHELVTAERSSNICLQDTKHDVQWLWHNATSRRRLWLHSFACDPYPRGHPCGLALHKLVGVQHLYSVVLALGAYARLHIVPNGGLWWFTVLQGTTRSKPSLQSSMNYNHAIWSVAANRRLQPNLAGGRQKQQQVGSPTDGIIMEICQWIM